MLRDVIERKFRGKYPARSLVSSDTFDSVRWFRKYDRTSRPRPFGARPTLKSSASGEHTYFTAVYATWYTNEREKEGGKSRKKEWKKSPIKRTCNTGGRKSADYRSSRDTLSVESRSRGSRGKRSLVSNKTDLWRIVRNVNLARSWRREFRLSALQYSYPSSKIVAQAEKRESEIGRPK